MTGTCGASAAAIFSKKCSPKVLSSPWWIALSVSDFSGSKCLSGALSGIAGPVPICCLYCSSAASLIMNFSIWIIIFANFTSETK